MSGDLGRMMSHTMMPRKMSTTRKTPMLANIHNKLLIHRFCCCSADPVSTMPTPRSIMLARPCLRGSYTTICLSPAILSMIDESTTLSISFQPIYNSTNTDHSSPAGSNTHITLPPLPPPSTLHLAHLNPSPLTDCCLLSSPPVPKLHRYGHP